MKNRLFVAASIFFLCFQTIQGQTYEEFVRQRQAEFEKFKSDRETAIAKMRKEYSDYVKKRDQEYSEYLKKSWNKYKVITGEKPQEKPKPRTIPVFKQQAAAPIKKIPTLPPRVDAPPAVLNLAKVPMIQKPEKEEGSEEICSYRFFGERISIGYDPGLKSIASGLNGKQAITNYWDKASETNYNQVISQLLNYREKLNINDYGYYLLVSNLASSIYLVSGQEDNRSLFTWFIMVRSGFDVRIAYNNKNIALLLPSYNTVYGKKFMVINNLKYYIFSPFDGEEIYTYDKTYDAANLPVDFNITTAMKFSSVVQKKSISFKFKEKSYAINVQVDQGVVDFFKNYPQVDPEVYFNAAVSRSTKQSLDDALTPILNGMTQEDAVNFLLAFVQRGFSYKTDPEQFGTEKFFFTEEVFHYPACDCEDRSVLFSYLVRNLLHLKMIGLESPDHMFTAIHFTTDAFGDYLTYHGDTYIVADPTYINAPFGRTMPSVSLQDARIITISNSENEAMTMQAAEAIALKAGIKKAGGMQNIVIDRSGNFFVTGYFSGTINLGTLNAKGYVDAQSYIVSRMDQNGKVLWADHIPSSENAAGIAIQQDKEGNIFVAGSFSGKLQEFTTSKGSDVFISRYTPTGERLWLQRGNVDSLSPASGMIYSLEVSKSGKKEHLRVVEYTPAYNGYGLYTEGKSIIFNGLINNTMVPAATTLALNNLSGYNSAELLKKEYDQFISKQTDRAIAGLFAISSLIRNAGMEISGKEVQKTFDTYNPGFRKKFPNMYKLIGKISFIKNSNNIITIMTENGNDVVFDKLKLTNKAQMRVSLLPDGNAQIDAVSGIKVGKMVVWYPLNYIRIYSKSGDLLFDYDLDHTQARMNMRKDILN